MKHPIVRLLVVLLVLVGAFFLLGERHGSALAASASSIPAPALDNPLASSPGTETAVLAGGCFWGIQAIYQHVKGVKSSVSGYAGGHTKSPSYEEVTTGRTGHAEVVRVTFDPSVVTYGQLLRILFSVAHDPTQLNRQGPDVGTQYRSEIFHTNPAQKRIADAYIAQLGEAGVFKRKIVTRVSPLGDFTVAEDYHQNYANEHPNQPYILIHDAPKVAALKKEFSSLYKEELSAWR